MESFLLSKQSHTGDLVELDDILLEKLTFPFDLRDQLTAAFDLIMVLDLNYLNAKVVKNSLDAHGKTYITKESHISEVFFFYVVYLGRIDIKGMVSFQRLLIIMYRT